MRMLDLRQKRQEKLRNLIGSEAKLSQQELVDLMRKAGFEVTQSSISRDLRELGAVKVAGRYVTADELQPKSSARSVQRFVKSIDLAGPYLVVVSTASGSANMIAELLDNREINGVCGTIAGDNTIFIATKNKAAQSRAVQAVKDLR